MHADLRRFLHAKGRSLGQRARRLSRLDHRSIGIRPEDLPYAPSGAHFDAANRRLAEIDRHVKGALLRLRSAMDDPRAKPEDLVAMSALVDREVDRARRTFGLFFEVLGQRGTAFAPALAACDAVAADCFQVVRKSAPGVLRGPLLKPVTYLEHGFSPATFRRGVVLTRLLGERNPFPLVRIPYERIESPWEMGVLLHEVGHNLQQDLGVWHETRLAVQRRVLQATGSAWLARVWTRWHREIFADLIAVLLGGPASARSMKDFLAYPASRVLTFRPLGVHPTPYLRVFLLAEMVRRIGFADDAAVLADVWDRLYTPHVRRGRVPAALLAAAQRLVPHVVDEVAFQPRRGLGHHALADVVPYGMAEERAVRDGAAAIAKGRVPDDLPPRLVVSASRVAFESRLAAPTAIARTVLGHLSRTRAPAAEPVVTPMRRVA